MTMRSLRYGLAAVALTSVTCSSGGKLIDRHDGGGVDAGNRLVRTISTSINRNVDILFMIDNSSSMRLSQTNLRANFPAFMTRLMDPPGLPNIHIGVISSDMGAGDGSIQGCSARTAEGAGGDNGIFHYTGNIIPPASTSCTTGLYAGQTFISNVGGVANYTGELADVFSCIAALGETGCGFEHQFASILRALGADGAAAPAENQGFLRPEAALAVIMLTNEDDCSETQGSRLFETNSSLNVSSEFGVPSNFRCNEFGHLCDGAHPRRLAPGNDVNATVTYGSCVSNDTEGYLLSTADVAARLKALKADPSQIAVVSIQGSPTPYTVHWKNPSTTDTSCGATSCPWPEITHTCVAQDGSFADPGVRTAQLANAFGANGLTLSICDNSLAPAFDTVASLVNGMTGPPCLGGYPAENPLNGTPDCTVTESYAKSNGTVGEVMVRTCSETGGVGPCWQLGAMRQGCVGPTLMFTPDPAITGETNVKFDCTPLTLAN